MNLFSTYLYFWGSLFGVLLFSILFYLRKDLRQEMLKTGIAVGLMGVASEYVFFQDYWRPPLIFQFGVFGGIEDFLFGLAAGGVGTAIYKIIFHKRLVNSHNPHYWIIPLVIASQLLSLFILSNILHINSIFASTIGFIIPVQIILLKRKDLFIEVIYSAILSGCILIFIESLFLFFAPRYLDHYFLLWNKINLIFGIVPITELIWGMTFGALLGPIYEFDYGERLVNIRTKKHK